MVKAMAQTAQEISKRRSDVRRTWKYFGRTNNNEARMYRPTVARADTAMFRKTGFANSSDAVGRPVVSAMLS